MKNLDIFLCDLRPHLFVCSNVCVQIFQHIRASHVEVFVNQDLGKILTLTLACVKKCIFLKNTIYLVPCILHPNPHGRRLLEKCNNTATRIFQHLNGYVNSEEAKLLSFSYSTGFLIKTWDLHNSHCNTVTDIWVRDLDVSCKKRVIVSSY